ncbi:T9SS type A sorting domain-containing protein [bacterium]|nr:T9SS type A sorting domain-containing protein [bacterium]
MRKMNMLRLTITTAIAIILVTMNMNGQTAADWPGTGTNTGTSWVAYRDANSNLIQDPNDMSPDYIDLWYSTADPASVSVAYDGSTTFYRFQLEASPIASNGKWENGTWIVQFGNLTNGFIGAVYVNVVGNSGRVAVSDGSNVDEIFTFSSNNNSPDGARVQQVPNATTYYLDFQVPMTALWNGSNTHLGLTETSIQSFFYGTSTAAGNPSQISKDFMIGAAVDFSTLTPTGFSIIGSGVLPVELTSFNAYLKSNRVELRWNTATELDNYGFSVERSVDGENWSEVSFIAGGGTSNTPRDYRFDDASLPRGAAKLYYRLRQIDRDGSYEYSSVVMVSLETSNAIAITDAFPNPFNPTTTVSYTLTSDGPVRLEMMDVTGRTVQVVVDEQLSAGMHSTVINAEELSSGRYFLVLTAGAQRSIHSVVLMK